MKAAVASSPCADFVLACHDGLLCLLLCPDVVSCSIGLKTVIEAASGNLAPPLAALVSSRMAAGVQQKVTLIKTQVM